jgi:N-glycosidase YbiA
VSESASGTPTLIIPADNRILYFARNREMFRFLSHFWPSPTRLDDQDWPTVEHYYQAQKSLDPAYRQAVRQAREPAIAKRLSVSWFKAAVGREPRPDWEAIKVDVMRRADEAKYRQNTDLAALLLVTGTAELIEDSPHDAFWGTGADGGGLNWAGRVLMEVREKLREARP